MMQAIRYKDLSDSYSAVPIEAGKTIQQNFPELALEDQVILANGKQTTPDYLVKEGDVIVLRSIPGSSVVTVVLLAVALIGAAYTGYKAYQMRKQVEEMQDAMSRMTENVVSLPTMRGAQNQSAENRFVPYFIGRNFFTPYKIMDMWKFIPKCRGASYGLQTMRVDELNTMVLLCGYQNLVFESISTDDVVIKTFTETTPQDGVYTADADSPFGNPIWYQTSLEIYQQTSGNFTTADYNRCMIHTDLGYELKKADVADYEDIILTLPVNTMNSQICMQFGRGLRYYNDDGDKKPRELSFKCEISYDGGDTWAGSGKTFYTEDAGSGAFIPADGSFTIKANTNKAFYKTLKYSAAYARVKDLTDPVMLKISCLTNTYDGTALDDVYIQWMASEIYNPDASKTANNFVREKILDDPERAKCTLLGIRVQTMQSIADKFSKVNIVASGVARTWNGSAWSTTRTATSNPAAWLLEVLTTTVHSPSKCLDAELDLDAFGELYEYCTTNSLECNMVITQGDTKESILQRICATCFASLYRSYTGKISVVYDDVRENAIAVFNTQNVISFKNRKDLSTITDGVRVSYIESQTWKQDAAIVMRPGKTRDGTSVIRDMSIDGVTNYDQAVFIARRIMAQELYREKETTIRVGREGAFYTPLAKVLVQHPSLKIGLGSAEIKSVVMSGTNMTGLVLYDPIEYQSAYADGYGMIIQCIADTYCTPLSKQYTAIADGMAKTVTFSTPINTLTAPAIPHAGDILSYGYLDSGSFDTITSPMLITGIDRDDTGYVLSLVDYNEDIYTTGAYPTYTPNITQPTARGFTSVTTVPTMEDVVAKVEEAKSPITVSGIPIYVARKTCLANCEIEGVDYLLYETATGWEIVTINEDESFTSYLTGTGTMYDMCNHLGDIIICGADGAWLIDADKEITIIYDSEVTSIQSDGSNLWGVVGGKICQFNVTDRFLNVYTMAGSEYRCAFYHDGAYYCFGNTAETKGTLYKQIVGNFSIVAADIGNQLLVCPTSIGEDLYVLVKDVGIYILDGSSFTLVLATSGCSFLCNYKGLLAYNNYQYIRLYNTETTTDIIYAYIRVYYANYILQGIEYNDTLIVAVQYIGNLGYGVDLYNITDDNDSTSENPLSPIWYYSDSGDAEHILYLYDKLNIQGTYVTNSSTTTRKEFNDSLNETSTTYEGYKLLAANGTNSTIFTKQDISSGIITIEATYPFGAPTPIDATVRSYSKLRLLADHLYCGVTDGDLYRVDNDALVKLTDTSAGYNAVAWRKDKIYAATDTAVYLVNDNGTVTAVENAVSATPIVELFVSGDYLIWCPTYATTGTLYAAFVEYTGSVNVWQDVTLYVPSDCPIGAVKTFRKMSAYSGTPVVITPPTGATFEGRASISLYGQYSFVEIERISATVFAIRDLRDEYTIAPIIKSGGSSTGATYSSNTGLVLITKGCCKVWGTVVLTSKPTTVGTVSIELTGAPIMRTGNAAPEMRLSNVDFKGQYTSYITVGGISINLNQLSEAGVISAISNAALANNSSFIFNVVYPS